jgi:ABC-type multidrug transport system permease subunit
VDYVLSGLASLVVYGMLIGATLAVLGALLLIVVAVLCGMTSKMGGTPRWLERLSRWLGANR